MNPFYTFLSAFLLFLAVSCSSQSAATDAYTDITSEEFNTKMSNPDVIVLDVRTPKEIKQGKIGNAIEIDFKSNDFDKKIAELDRDKTYLVYCAGGYRSSKACKNMSKKGFTKLYNLEGGYSSWQAK